MVSGTPGTHPTQARGGNTTLARRLVCLDIFVRVLWVTTGFQPVDPMSRLTVRQLARRARKRALSDLNYVHTLSQRSNAANSGEHSTFGRFMAKRTCFVMVKMCMPVRENWAKFARSSREIPADLAQNSHSQGLQQT